VIARTVDYASGELLDTRYLLCDPQLSGHAAHVACWSLWADNAEVQFRTLRHALDHFAQDGEGASAAGGGLAALQLGVTALRLEHSPTATAPAFLARLAGRSGTRQPGSAAVAGPVLNEGMGRLLALLDVLESYPGREPDGTPDTVDLLESNDTAAAIGAPQPAIAAPAGSMSGLPELMVPGVAL
jgi:flagellar biosynthesis protein FlhF